MFRWAGAAVVFALLFVIPRGSARAASGDTPTNVAQDCRGAYLDSDSSKSLACFLLKNAIAADPGLPISVGASDLVETVTGWPKGHRRLRLSQVLDGCQTDPPGAPPTQPPMSKFDCTLMVTNVTALAYRDKSFGAEFVTDAGSTLTIAGMMGALIEYQQNTSAVRWTSLVGIIPILSEQSLEMRPRERLYLISATAMSTMASHYYRLHGYIDQATASNFMARADPKTIALACNGISELSASVGKWKVTSEQLTVTPEVTELQTRCAAISAAANLLSSDFVTLNSLNQDKFLAESLALDAKTLDDRVALLDRDLRATPTQAFRYALGAPFTLVGKILSGSAQTSAVSDPTTAEFAKPFTLTLSAAPTITLPTLPTAPLAIKTEVVTLATSANKAVTDKQTAVDTAKKAAGKKTASSAAVKQANTDLTSAQAARDQDSNFQNQAAGYIGQLNDWLAVLNQVNASLGQVQALAAAPVLTIDYTANNQPVSIVKPPPPATTGTGAGATTGAGSGTTPATS